MFSVLVGPRWSGLGRGGFLKAGFHGYARCNSLVMLDGYIVDTVVVAGKPGRKVYTAEF